MEHLMVPRQGFEPQFQPSKGRVLPLDERGISVAYPIPTRTAASEFTRAMLPATAPRV